MLHPHPGRQQSQAAQPCPVQPPCGPACAAQTTQQQQHQQHMHAHRAVSWACTATTAVVLTSLQPPTTSPHAEPWSLLAEPCCSLLNLNHGHAQHRTDTNTEQPSCLHEALLVSSLAAPHLARRSLRPVASASTAMTSEATAMSKPVSRLCPRSSGPWPTVMPRRNLQQHRAAETGPVIGAAPRQTASRAALQIKGAGGNLRRNS